MNGAIEPYRPARLPALIELLGSDVACTLSFTKRKHRGDADTCALTLANKTSLTVSGRLFGLDRRNRTCDFGRLTVTANGLGVSVFSLPAEAAACERVHLEVIGHGLRLSADASLARTRRAPSGFPVAGISALLVAGALAIGTIWLVERPVVTNAVAPQAAVPAPVTALVSTHVRANGASLPFVSAPAARVAHAAPRRPRATAVIVPPPRIAYFTANRETYAGMSGVLASYQASGERGELRVLDEHGKVLGSRNFSHAGTTRIPLAPGVAGQTLLVDLEVVGGGAHAISAIVIPGEAGMDGGADTGTDGSAPAGAAKSAGDGGSVPAPSDPFFVRQRVVAGREFTIAIAHPMPNLRIALQNTTGTTIDEVDVPSNAHSVTLLAPSSTMVEVYYLAGTFTRASAEETLIRSLRIYPE